MTRLSFSSGKFRRVLTRYGLALALLAAVAGLNIAFLGNRSFAPVVNTAYLLALTTAAWKWGAGPGILVSCALFPLATAIRSGGTSVIPRDINIAVAGVLLFIVILASRVATTRRRMEAVLRSANEELENKVKERTTELERAREWLQITLASIGDAVIATGTDGRVILLNGVAQSLTGWTQEQAAGRPLEEVFVVVNEETRASVENPALKALRNGRVMGLANHTVLLARDGREIPIDDSAAPIFDRTGEVAGVVLIFRDVAHRRRIERERERLLEQARASHGEAEQQRSQIRSLFLQAPAIINFQRGPDHVFELVHPLMKELLGGRPMEGLPMRQALPELEAQGFVQVCDEVYRTGSPYVGDEVPAQFTMADGSVKERYFHLICNPWRDLDGSIAGVMTLAIDASEQVETKRAMEATQERLRETAKLESLGVLAGGIAHDFNNLLVGMLGNASLALELLPAHSQARGMLEGVVSASEKAALLTRQMLAYSGKGKFIIEPVDLSGLVEEILPLISRSVPRGVSLYPRLSRRLPAVEADRSQLQQVIMNLVINAAEACDDESGMVKIATGVERVDAQYAHPTFGLPAIQPGTFVFLEVSDTGSGMTEEIRAKIFDPFFTTKFTGRGLGLSAVLGIIRAHKGAIQVDSTAGQGTAFRVLFPAGAAPFEDRAPAAGERRELAGSGTILVVDDEEVVRRMAKSALENYGYQVLVAENGRVAVDLFARMAGLISLVILDLTMPVMNGETALSHLQRIQPGVKIVLSSGFNESEATKRFEGKSLAGFLQKPYTAPRLAEKVKAVLAASQSSETAGA
ncbi:MAG: PAS domain-containing protein [Bryobacteraceae bacterium]